MIKVYDVSRRYALLFVHDSRYLDTYLLMYLWKHRESFEIVHEIFQETFQAKNFIKSYCTSCASSASHRGGSRNFPQGISHRGSIQGFRLPVWYRAYPPPSPEAEFNYCTDFNVNVDNVWRIHRLVLIFRIEQFTCRYKSGDPGQNLGEGGVCAVTSPAPATATTREFVALASSAPHLL